MTPSFRLLPHILLLAQLCLLAGCGDAVEVVRESHLEPDRTRSVAEALEKYPYFTKVAWSSYEDKDGKTIVEAQCDIDVAANCQDVALVSLRLATKDVRRDYFVAEFVVAGWPRKVRPQYAIHVTQCSNGNKLSYTDPKYLAAIYRGERVRYFCMEGLNCPSAELGASMNATAVQ